MNNQQRQEVQFDKAAEQAKAEGTSSFGHLRSPSKKVITQYHDAAIRRGVYFILDTDGVGLFVDESCLGQFGR